MEGGGTRYGGVCAHGDWRVRVREGDSRRGPSLREMDSRGGAKGGPKEAKRANKSPKKGQSASRDLPRDA